MPWYIECILKVLSYITVFIFDIIDALLIPITWLQFKAHIAILVCFLIAGGYWYINGEENPVRNAVVGFLCVSLIIAVIKLIKKWLKKPRNKLMRYFYGMMPLYIRFKTPDNPFQKPKNLSPVINNMNQHKAGEQKV